MQQVKKESPDVETPGLLINVLTTANLRQKKFIPN